jgi:nickel-dependent lactate racemase
LAEFRLPWGSWFGDRLRAFDLPGGYEARVCGIRGAPEIGGDEIVRRLREPLGVRPLPELARGRRDAIVVIEDLTRPARLADVLPAVLSEIHAGGIPPDRTRILVGNGGHAPLDLPAMRKKVGRMVLERYDVRNHHPYEDLIDLGRSDRGIPIHVNRSFATADLKIAIGSCLPHPYAGFGGGAKIVVPGVSGIETLEANHRPAVTGVRGGYNDVETNTARAEMEEIALRVGLEAIVNVVTDDRRRTIGLFYGHPVEAHRAAVRAAREAYATRLPDAPSDVLILNAYPKDTELLQVGNVFNPLRSARSLPIREGGTIVVTAACPLGKGYHSLHGPGMRLYRNPIERGWLGGRPVIFHSPSLNAREAAISFWEGYPFERTWKGVVRRLLATVGERASVTILPCAPLQILEG